MKKILSACLVLFTMQMTNAQTITLTSANNYEIGDKFTSREYEPGNLVVGDLTDPATSRDFSGKTLKSTYQNEVVAVPSGDVSTYPSANLALQSVKSTKTEYQYYQATTNELINWGYKNTDIGSAVNTDGYKYLSYPFSLNSTFTDNFSGTASLSLSGFSGNSTRTATVTSTADEEASLVLNNAVTYEKALRIKNVATITDVVTIFPLPSPVTATTNITSFTWYTQTAKFPVLTIIFSETTVPGFGTQSQVLFIQNAVEAPAGIASLELSKEINLFPNPSNSQINLTYGLKEATQLKVNVNSIDGKFIKTLYEGRQAAGDQQIFGDVSGLQKGMYYVEIIADNKRQVSKLVID
ncbi:MAG: T9SS type A sorting domain-containing protein [Sporocytophaga sp.]|uniref:T9SS type A sorting domain-containing protein n=1 Tax=Sporocytophaga sp. TaxID=2231183 RepID=UPI001AFE5F1B|nr:T9SS type A sorting domain-containing protein [Sporocytophaga sp.]MBO9698788.1 T9SS type A sorting domain-containing protein [Sporocytophaga sp.]